MESLCVLPKSVNKVTELRKVIAWQLAQVHDPDRYEMAGKRTHSARTFNVINDQDYLEIIDMIARQAEAERAS